MVTQIPKIECQALVAFYQNILVRGRWFAPDLRLGENWLSNNQPGSWQGLVVSDGHVVELDFYDAD
ncbi:MAG TPA: hypothetical protein VFF78_05475, partial [Anaerolineaceae bacterium]|nr:hypothetical protein [Anaerolineaceae bacterium]